MKFTLSETMGMSEGLNDILGKEIPAKVAYWLARFLEKINSETNAMEKARLKLADKYAEKDEEGNLAILKDENGVSLNQYKFKDGNLAKFAKEYEELSKEEFDVDFKPISIDRLDGIKLKPITLIQLAKIIVE